MSSDETRDRSGLTAVAAQIITWWALLGGLTLLAVVAVNVLSVIGGIVWEPFPGDFELTEIGVAIAAFAFLPYCQITGANVTADIFTARAPRRMLDTIKVIASVVALGFAALLLWRMSAGMISQREYGYVTAILSLPIWWGFVPIVISLGLLVVAAAISLKEAWTG